MYREKLMYQSFMMVCTNNLCTWSYPFCLLIVCVCCALVVHCFVQICSLLLHLCLPVVIQAVAQYHTSRMSHLGESTDQHAIMCHPRSSAINSLLVNTSAYCFHGNWLMLIPRQDALEWNKPCTSWWILYTNNLVHKKNCVLYIRHTYSVLYKKGKTGRSKKRSSKFNFSKKMCIITVNKS